MPKKTTHPLITEILLGKSVDELIQEHFSAYTLSDVARRHLPRLIREIIQANDKALRFAIRLELDNSLMNAVVQLKPYTCQSDITLNYGSERSFCHQSDCIILNEIVRRLFGITRKDPKGTLTHGFVSKTAVPSHCGRCGRTKADRYEQVLVTHEYRFGYRLLICQRCDGVITSGVSKTWLGG
jgi:hypothetical protein